MSDKGTMTMLDAFNDDNSIIGVLGIALQKEFEADADLLNDIGAVEEGLKDGGLNPERAVKVLAIMREGLEERLPTVGFLVTAANTICRQLRARESNTGEAVPMGPETGAINLDQIGGPGNAPQA